MKIKITFIALLTTLIIIFALQNTRIVEIEVAIWKLRMPRSLLIIIILYIGFSMGRTFEYIRSGTTKKKGS